MTRTGAIGAIASATAAAAIWGSWFPLSRLAVTTGLSPLDIGLLRFLVTGAALLPLALSHRFRFGRFGPWASVAAAGLIGAPYPIMLAHGLTYAPAAHVAIFVPGLFPLITFLLGMVVLGDPATPKRLLGLACGVGGVLLVGIETVERAGWGRLQGYLLFLLCACMWSGYTVLARLARVAPMQATAMVNVVSLIGVLPVWWLAGGAGVLDLPLVTLGWQLAFQGVLVGFVSLVAYNHAVARLGAAPAAMFGGLVPCLAAVLAVPLLGETMTPMELVGLAAVTLGIVLVTGAALPRLRRAEIA